MMNVISKSCKCSLVDCVLNASRKRTMSSEPMMMTPVFNERQQQVCNSPMMNRPLAMKNRRLFDQVCVLGVRLADYTNRYQAFHFKRRSEKNVGTVLLHR
jgi:hypothetical protein